ncbi:MAG TPA: hypothetical protein PLK15_01605 [Chitinophagales bacterium]|nr:hypothetical protein [Chitinophagales bacterium]
MSAVPFNEFRSDQNISYSIRQGVLYNMRNFFFARREMKKNLSLVALKIVNNSDTAININDLKFTCGALLPIQQMEVKDYFNAVKQKPALYWLYSLGAVVYPKPAVYRDPVTDIQYPKPNNSKKFIKNGKQFIPIPIGLPIAAANYAIAYRSNKKMLLDFQLLNLTNRIVQPHDTIQGILMFKNTANCSDIYISSEK